MNIKMVNNPNITLLKKQLCNKVKKFKAGALKYLSEWKKLTSDQEILQTVSGLRIEPSHFPNPSEYQYENHIFSEQKLNVIDTEINNLGKACHN